MPIRGHDDRASGKIAPPKKAEPSVSRTRLGAFGERCAAEFYEAHGYTIVARNWRPRSGQGRGEIDLICWRRGTVVFCEVKTRSSDRYGLGVEAVGPAKQRQLRRLAAIWLEHEAVGALGRGRRRVRFDIIDVDARGHIQPYPDAF